MSVIAMDVTDQKRTAFALRQSETYFRALIEHSSDIITVLSLDGVVLFESPSFERLLGYNQHELDGRIAFEFVHPDDLPIVLERFQLVIQQPEEPQVAEFRFRHKDRSWLSLEGIGRSILDTEGQRCVIVNSRDITERKRAEALLWSSQEKLRQALHASNTGLWDWNTDTNEVSISREWKRQLGYEEGDLPDTFEAWESRLHPKDRASALAYVWSYLAHPQGEYQQEFRLRHKDGTYRWIEARASFVTEPDGRRVRLLGSHTDITARTQAAQREAARLQQLKTLSELGLTLSGDPTAIFGRVVRMIGELFKVRVVCLSEIVGQELHFKAVYINGQVVLDAGRCPLGVTPCATVEMDKDLRLFDRVMERFPQASFLRDHNAVSYCGFPALDAHNQVVAVTCLLDDKPHEFTAEDQELLRVFGQRLAIEFERANYIAQQKRQAEELRRSHTFIRQIIDMVPNFIFAKDRDGRFILANNAVANAYGTTVENLIGKTDADFNPNGEEVQFFRQKDREVMDSLQEWFTLEEKITDATGKVRWLQTVKRPILDDQGRADMVLGAATDITERRQMEEMLRQREQDLCAALEERQRISEDLHDGILQSIYAVGLGLESCKMLVSTPPRQRKKADTQLLATFERAIGQLSHLMAEVRNFIAGLESKVLQGVDFASALRAMIQTMSASSYSKCKTVIDEAAARQFSTEQALHLMNLVREALSNSLRHSEARNVTVSLKRLRRSVRLSVIDDGIGFTPASVGDAGHGLANMAARARKLGGRLNVCSRPRLGTKVLLDLPRRSADE